MLAPTPDAVGWRRLLTLAAVAAPVAPVAAPAVALPTCATAAAAADVDSALAKSIAFVATAEWVRTGAGATAAAKGWVGLGASGRFTVLEGCCCFC